MVVAPTRIPLSSRLAMPTVDDEETRRTSASTAMDSGAAQRAAAHEEGGVQRQGSIAMEQLGSAAATPEHSSTAQRTASHALAKPQDRGRDAWAFVAASFTIETVVWGHIYSYGIFQEYHSRDPASPLLRNGTPPLVISMIGTLALAGGHCAPLLFSGLLINYPHRARLASLAGAIMSSGSLLVASLAPTNPTVLLIFQGILYGLNAGLSFTPILLWLPEWFDRRRGTASGIIYAGSGIGGVIFPYILSFLLKAIGFEWTLRAVALANLALTVGAWLGLQPRLRPQPPARETRARAGSTLPTLDHLQAIMKRLLPGNLRPLRGRLSLLALAALCFQTAAWCTVSLYIATYASSLGLSSSESTGMLAAFNASATVGLLVVGRLIDATLYTRIMALSTIICAVASAVLLGFAHTLGTVLAFVLLFGIAGGGFTTFMTPISRDVAELGNVAIGPVYLALVFWRGVAAVGGPLVASTLYNSDMSDYKLYGTRGFSGIVVFTSIGMACSTLLIVLANMSRSRSLLTRM